jgi:hypothetical protein
MDVLSDSTYDGSTAPAVTYQHSEAESHTDKPIPDPQNDNRLHRTRNQEHNKLNKLRQKEKNRSMRATKTDEPFSCPWCKFLGGRSNDLILHM